MDIIKIVAIGLIALFLIIIIKQYRPEFTIYISLIAGTIILFFVVDKLSEILGILSNLGSKSGIDSEYILILFKITGIAYLTEYAMNICNDSRRISNCIKNRNGWKNFNDIYVVTNNISFNRGNN